LVSLRRARSEVIKFLSAHWVPNIFVSSVRFLIAAYRIEKT
jgi:hypothetical protein